MTTVEDSVNLDHTNLDLPPANTYLEHLDQTPDPSLLENSKSYPDNDTTDNEIYGENSTVVNLCDGYDESVKNKSTTQSEEVYDKVHETTASEPNLHFMTEYDNLHSRAGVDSLKLEETGDNLEVDNLPDAGNFIVSESQVFDYTKVTPNPTGTSEKLNTTFEMQKSLNETANTSFIGPTLPKDPPTPFTIRRMQLLRTGQVRLSQLLDKLESQVHDYDKDHGCNIEVKRNSLISKKSILKKQKHKEETKINFRHKNAIYQISKINDAEDA